MRFDKQTVLVTGGSRGIGREIAKGFAARGAQVAVHFNSNEKATQQTLDQLAGTGHFALRADLADSDQVQRMVDEAAARMGRLDILVNNAGIHEERLLTECSYAEWGQHFSRVLGVNLIGAANTMHCAARHMIRQGGGRIVNISSRGAFRGEPTAPAYGASKAALNSLGQSLAKLLAPHNIFIGAVAPGFVQTDMAAERLAAAGGDEIRAQSPLGRVAKPQEVAYAALFLASAGAEFTTGTIIDVNGASYLRS
ncbi:MAG: SDR family NAD(P)-dependent oxidoreductase [Chloroflexi bacterium]|nr:SDR family NAD(P)-dependent oxidoreductase [Chloroflexota bacterium]MCY4247602.1 SDR family NAD(P)-dependent oxidoreductase [Chloroflexota bacterium]